uniref:Uncharacterized protein n=1 Tax=Tetradesmus obliquus TaxID=3088 RepID=A0A383W0E9_TETOB|eukprot:jgi/Sobl393_1/7838/SZX71168.1
MEACDTIHCVQGCTNTGPAAAAAGPAAAGPAAPLGLVRDQQQQQQQQEQPHSKRSRGRGSAATAAAPATPTGVDQEDQQQQQQQQQQQRQLTEMGLAGGDAAEEIWEGMGPKLQAARGVQRSSRAQQAAAAFQQQVGALVEARRNMYTTAGVKLAAVLDPKNTQRRPDGKISGKLLQTEDNIIQPAIEEGERIIKALHPGDEGKVELETRQLLKKGYPEDILWLMVHECVTGVAAPAGQPAARQQGSSGAASATSLGAAAAAGQEQQQGSSNSSSSRASSSRASRG